MCVHPTFLSRTYINLKLRTRRTFFTNTIFSSPKFLPRYPDPTPPVKLPCWQLILCSIFDAYCFLSLRSFCLSITQKLASLMQSYKVARLKNDNSPDHSSTCISIVLSINSTLSCWQLDILLVLCPKQNKLMFKTLHFIVMEYTINLEISKFTLNLSTFASCLNFCV